MKIAFIRERLAGAFPASLCCRVLGVSRSGYHAARARPIGPREAHRAGLLVKIRAAHEANRCVYGSPRVCACLRAAGERVCVNTVARLMREEGLAARRKKRFAPRTTDSAHGRPAADNLLGRDFAADRPGSVWVADITYIPTDEGWLYLAAVMDLASRKIAGWSMTDHMREELTRDALVMALARRAPLPGAVHHSDRGVQYACEGYRGLLAGHGITASMSRKGAPGSCYDNAPMESFWATLKTELVHRERYATRGDARASIFEYIEVFYNRQRLHSSLGYQSPEAFEASLN